MTDPNYTHPNCGGLTDAEREALFWYCYWSSRPLVCLLNYLKFLDLSFSQSMASVNSSLRVKGMFCYSYPRVKLSKTGIETVAKLESGAW